MNNYEEILIFREIILIRRWQTNRAGHQENFQANFQRDHRNPPERENFENNQVNFNINNEPQIDEIILQGEIYKSVTLESTQYK